MKNGKQIVNGEIVNEQDMLCPDNIERLSNLSTETNSVINAQNEPSEPKLSEEDVNLGPYSLTQYEQLNNLAEIRTRIIKHQMKDGVPKDLDDINSVAALLKDAESTIHKTASAISRHDSDVSQATSAETIAAYLSQVNLDATTEFQSKTFHDKNSIGEADVPNIVPDQMLDGVSKPTLKEIMDTNMEDDDDE